MFAYEINPSAVLTLEQNLGKNVGPIGIFIFLIFLRNKGEISLPIINKLLPQCVIINA